PPMRGWARATDGSPTCSDALDDAIVALKGCPAPAAPDSRSAAAGSCPRPDHESCGNVTGCQTRSQTPSPRNVNDQPAGGRGAGPAAGLRAASAGALAPGVRPASNSTPARPRAA